MAPALLMGWSVGRWAVASRDRRLSRGQKDFL